MLRLRQIVRPRYRQMAWLLAFGGQLFAITGLAVRLPAAPVSQSNPTAESNFSARAARVCCCATGDRVGPCRCCCTAEAPEPQSPATAQKWILVLGSAHCQGHGPLVAGSLPPCLPGLLPGPERWAAPEVGSLADECRSPTRLFLPFPTPPPRNV